MLSALIPHPRNAFDLAVSLHDLVGGAVDGIVREAIVVGAEDGEVADVAEHAGCRLASEAEFLHPGFSIRGEWLLTVHPGERLPAGWIEALARHMGQVGAGAAGRLPSVTRHPSWQFWKPRRTAAWLVPTGAAFAHMRKVRRVEASGAGLPVRRLRVEN